MEKGKVLFEATDADDARVVEELSRQYGVAFIDARNTKVRLYEEQGLLANGFPNSGGPGDGHLNERGIDAVFGFVATRLRKLYGF